MPVLQMKCMKKQGLKLLILNELYSSADIVLKVQRPLENPTAGKNELDLLKEGTILIAFLYPLNYTKFQKNVLQKKLILFRWM